MRKVDPLSFRKTSLYSKAAALPVIAYFVFMMTHHIKNSWKGLSSYDLYFHYVPYLTFARNSLLSGIFPLWNPFQAMGRPFFAELQIGLLYPPNWVILLLQPKNAALAIQLMSVLIGMITMFFYLRYLKLDELSIAFGTLLFGFVVVRDTAQLCQSSSICWVPLIILLIHRLIDEPTFFRSVGLAAGLTIFFLAGYPQNFYYLCITLFLYFLFVVLLQYRRYGAKGVSVRLVWLTLALAIMTGLVSVQLLPAMELSLHSVRNFSDTFSSATDRFVVKMNLLTADIWLGSTLFVGYHFGILVFLVPFAFAKRNLQPVVIGLFAAFGYSILFVLSKQVSFLKAFGGLPGEDIFRIHVRMFSFSLLLLAIIGAIGLSSFWERAPLRFRDRITGKVNWFWVFILFFESILLYLVLVFTREAFSYKKLLVIVSLPSFILLLNFYSPLFSKRWRVFSSVIVALVVLYDISSYDFFLKNDKRNRWELINPVAAQDLEIHKNCAENSRILLNGNLSYPNKESVFRFYGINSYTPFNLSRWNNFTRVTIGPENFDSIAGDPYGTVDRLRSLLLEHPESLGLLSLRYFITGPVDAEAKLVEQEPDAWKLIYERETEPALCIFENMRALPRAYLVNSYIMTNSEEQSLLTLKEHASMLHGCAVVEGGQPSFPSSTTPQGAGKVEITDDRMNEIEVKVESKTSALLVLADSYYPGWVALVDGIRQPIWRANSLFRAVEVPSGRHEVVFKYRPLSFFLGISISFLMLFVNLLVLFRLQLRKKRESLRFGNEGLPEHVRKETRPDTNSV